MSRIGKLPIAIPAGVQINVSDDNIVTVKGKLGQLQQQVDPRIRIRIDGNNLLVERSSEEQEVIARHGLYRSLVFNMVKGVSEGFKTVQELVGVGYKATNTGQVLELSLGYSHNIMMVLPEEVSVETTAVKGKNNSIILKSIDKQLIGQVAAKIRSFRRPEPYKGKGIRFENEEIKKKAGKSAAGK
jgi:large subunit ribosomal protein L6